MIVKVEYREPQNKIILWDKIYIFPRQNNIYMVCDKTMMSVTWGIYEWINQHWIKGSTPILYI